MLEQREGLTAGMMTEREGKRNDDARVRWLGYGACAAAGCLWGTGFYFGKIALREMSVAHMVLYRFLFACMGMLPAAVFSRDRRRWQRSDLQILLLSALLGIPIQFLMQFHGLARTTVSHAALMVGTMPVLLAVAAAIFLGERLDWIGWAALLASTVGVGCIVLGGHPASASGARPTLAGDLLVVVSLAIALGWVLMSKRLMDGHSPLAVSAWTILSGTAMLAAWVLAVDGLPPVRAVSVEAWLALAASGLLCTATTTFLWNWGIHHVPASRAGVFLNIEPALGSLLGVELLGDRLGPLAWVGGGLILVAAVTLTTLGHPVEPEILIE